MGYTHYWTQKRNFTKAEWAQVSTDIAAILKDVQHAQGVPLCNWEGGAGTGPEIDGDRIAFNGLGEDGHETMTIRRARYVPDYEGGRTGRKFCKTAQKPYDLAVTACLSYLATVTRRDDPATAEPIDGTESHSVSSDGDGADWIAGVEEARRALPRYANHLDIPMAVMESDRWCAPWVSDSGCKGHEVHFCVDGKGYVIKTASDESYCFESHVALAQFLDRTKRVAFAKGGGTGLWHYGPLEENIWNATGSFDKARHARIARAQAKALASLFPVDPACAQRPPAYVRPGEMPKPETFCYRFEDILKMAKAA